MNGSSLLCRVSQFSNLLIGNLCMLSLLCWIGVLEMDDEEGFQMGGISKDDGLNRV